MDIPFLTNEVEIAVNKIRQRSWRIRVATLSTMLLALAMYHVLFPTNYAFIALVVAICAGIHLTAEFYAARRFKPTMNWTEVLRQLYVERRYFQEFSPAWRVRIAEIEVELLEKKRNSATEATRLYQEQVLAEQRHIASMNQEDRNRRRIVQKAERIGLSVHFRNQVVILLNAGKMEQARELVEHGKSLRELLDRLEATQDDPFIENWYNTLQEKGVAALEEGLERWNRRNDLIAHVTHLNEELQDNTWLAQVIAACDEPTHEKAQCLIAKGEECVRRLREIRMFEARIEVIPHRMVDRRATLLRQADRLKQTASTLKAREYRKARHELQNGILTAESAI